MSRRGGLVETSEYAAFTRRIIRGFGRRVGDGEPLDLAELVAVRDEMNDVIRQAVHAMRERHGWSWAEIARELGTTRQNAQQRFGGGVTESRAAASDSVTRPAGTG